MDDATLRELEQPESWDFEHAEGRPGRRIWRAVVSVAFSRPDYERVTLAAERDGRPTSGFIRDAALEKACSDHRDAVVMMMVTSSLGATFYGGSTRYVTSRVSGPAVEPRQEVVSA